jgi:hypothetical protein
MMALKLTVEKLTVEGTKVRDPLPADVMMSSRESKSPFN